MKSIYILKITCMPTDMSWKWAFTHVPTPSEIAVTVHTFLEKWANDPTVAPYYAPWKDVFFAGMDKFGGYGDEGMPCERIPGHRAYARLTKIEVVS